MPAPEPVFLITGASSGIGEATARHASKAGYRLVLSARSTDRLERLADELPGSVAGRRALPGSLYSATKWAVTAMGESARQEFNDTGVRVTLIEPGMVDTRFFDDGAPPDALQADDVARAVMFAVSQPAHVDVNEILVRPTAQS